MYDIIDLHLIPGQYDPKDSLTIQLGIFEKELDNALVKGLLEFRVIHGMGEGILKREVHKILKNYPHVKEFSNDYHPLYGWGSTKITFK